MSTASATRPSASIAARMDRLPITGLHRRVVVVIGLGLFFDIYEIFLSGTLSQVLAKQFKLSGDGLTWLLSSAFLGMFIGCVYLGRLADRLGRRRAFLLSLAIYSVFTLVAAFAPNVGVLVACRFLAGLGIGAEPPVSDTYLGDVLPPEQRGRCTSWAYVLSFLGVPAAGFLGRWLVPLTPLGIDGWRWLFGFGALGAVVIFLLRRGLPESPRWLASVGREAEADAVVRRFEESATRAGQALPEPSLDVPPVTQDGRVRELFVAPYARRTWMMVVFHFFQSWGYYGFGTLVPTVLAAKGYDTVTSLLFVGLSYLGYPVGALLAVPIIERLERKQLVIGSALLMSVFGLAFGFASGPPMIVAMGFLYTVASNVFSNAFHTYQAEIFPTRLRGTASSSTYALSRLSSGLMPFILVPLFHATSAAVLFAVVAGAMLVVAVDVAVLGPRATGRSLSEVNGPTR